MAVVYMDKLFWVSCCDWLCLTFVAGIIVLSSLEDRWRCLNDGRMLMHF